MGNSTQGTGKSISLMWHPFKGLFLAALLGRDLRSHGDQGRLVSCGLMFLRTLPLDFPAHYPHFLSRLSRFLRALSQMILG